MYSTEILIKELFQVKRVRECLLQHCLQCKHIQGHLFIINKATEEIWHIYSVAYSEIFKKNEFSLCVMS